jgi:hypothetical protein
MVIYHILGSDYAEFARHDVGDVHNWPYQHAVQKMHIDISTHAENAYQ